MSLFCVVHPSCFGAKVGFQPGKVGSFISPRRGEKQPLALTLTPTASLGLPGGLMCCFWTVRGNRIMLWRTSTETGRTCRLQFGDWTRNLNAAPPCPCRSEILSPVHEHHSFNVPNWRFSSFCDDSLHPFPCLNYLPPSSCYATRS